MVPFLPLKRTVPMPCPRVLCDALAIWLQLPTRRLVFNRPGISLELGVARPARLVLAAIFVEAGDGLPCPISSGLTRHRVEASGKGILVRQLRAERLHVVLTDAAPIHPEPDGLVADEL